MAGWRGKMMSRSFAGKPNVARALWYTAPGVVELRSAPLQPPQTGEARVRSLFSGISRGTERLVFTGGIAAAEWERMRAPMQEGAFPFPVKYGYCATGIVEEGPADLLGRNVFCLHPHQTYFNAPVADISPIPETVPLRRATLTANMETSLNAVWDSGAGPGDRIVVIGAGVVGLLVLSLVTRLPGTVVTGVDTDETRRPIIEALGAGYARPEHTPGDVDVVFHASASAAGLATAINCAGFEGTIVEMSWYGNSSVDIDLGGAFHSRRLRLISSQVSQIAPSRRPRWDFRRRREAALGLLDLPAIDALVAEEIAFEDAPSAFPNILAANAGGLAPVIRYPAA
jgi:threonine dehydrogenase-like Zn-dependent dehydrogenase